MRKILVLSLLTLTLLGIGCNKSAQQASEPVTLTIWGVFDDDDNYDTVIEDYRAQHPNVSISFREFPLRGTSRRTRPRLGRRQGAGHFLGS